MAIFHGQKTDIHETIGFTWPKYFSLFLLNNILLYINKMRKVLDRNDKYFYSFHFLLESYFSFCLKICLKMELERKV